jgi:biotin carboxylase
MITGVDLIQEQIRVAQGEKLRFTQDDIKFKVGGAVCRFLEGAVGSEAGRLRFASHRMTSRSRGGAGGAAVSAVTGAVGMGAEDGRGNACWWWQGLWEGKGGGQAEVCFV